MGNSFVGIDLIDQDKTDELGSNKDMRLDL